MSPTMAASMGAERTMLPSHRCPSRAVRPSTQAAVRGLKRRSPPVSRSSAASPSRTRTSVRRRSISWRVLSFQTSSAEGSMTGSVSSACARRKPSSMSSGVPLNSMTR